MREIKFRGKRKDNGEWVFGMPWIFKDRACICPWHEGMCKRDTGFYPVRVDPETVGQFVMWDKNCKEVYEGSICHARNELHNGKEGLYTVAWYENGFYFVDRYGDPWHPDNLDGIEVVGDMHDIPGIAEVLKHV